ncbi:oxygenase [alpha proteobacterium AAP81b]|nr:oxygenase [alpha proteobacterium AAP81b]
MSPAFAGAQRLPTRLVELYLRRGFLGPDDCAALIERIDAGARPSTIADDDGTPGFRTSATCDLDPADPLVADVVARLAAYAGLDPRHCEPLQGQRYRVGQEFKLHTDYFEAGADEALSHVAAVGRRTWTLMVYLNEPAAGGATRFKRLDKTIAPETGKLVAWNNIAPDGANNYETLHAGLPVRAGVKYIVTAWFRERPW